MGEEEEEEKGGIYIEKVSRGLVRKEEGDWWSVPGSTVHL